LVRLRPFNQVICVPAPCVAIALLVVYRRRRASESRANYRVWNGGRFCPQNCLPRQLPLRDLKNNQIVHLRPKFYKSCKFSEDRPVDVEIMGLTEIAKKYLKNETSAKHKPSMPALRAERLG